MKRNSIFLMAAIVLTTAFVVNIRKTPKYQENKRGVANFNNVALVPQQILIANPFSDHFAGTSSVTTKLLIDQSPLKPYEIKYLRPIEVHCRSDTRFA